jgi:hypothetical protein
LRFNGQQIREEMADYCLPKIGEMINRLDGLKDESLVPRSFVSAPEGLAQQLSLLEEEAEYNIDTDW